MNIKYLAHNTHCQQVLAVYIVHLEETGRSNKDPVLSG